jgi:hypothetical protein
MLKFIVAMLIPLWIAIYTVSFARWLRRRKDSFAAWISAYLLSIVSLGVSGVALWRIFT